MGSVAAIGIAVPGHGLVPGLWRHPAGGRAALLLGAGAGSRLDAPLLQTLAEALAAREVATLRYHYPYTEARRRRPDPPAVLLATVRAAAAAMDELAPGMRCFLGGHSMGGRLATLLMVSPQPPPRVNGLVCLSFPLAGKAVARTAPLARLAVPLLLVQGSRDALTPLGELQPIVAGLAGRVLLHRIEGADHGLRRRGRSPRETTAAWQEAASAVATWLLESGS